MKKKAAIVVVTALIFAAVLLVQRLQNRKSAAGELEAQILRELTEDDVKLILKNEELVAPPLSINELKSSKEARSEYLQRLRDTLALAAQARSEGLNAKGEFEILREMGAKATLALIYSSGEQDAKPMQAFKAVTKDEILEFFKDPRNEERFQLEVKTQLTVRHAIYVAENKNDASIAVPKLEAEDLDHARERWARAAIGAQKARADTDFMRRPEVQLQLKLQEARLLASGYFSLQLAAKTEPTAAQIAAYLAAHPEYDVNSKRKKAEQALQRAKAGEDFVKLFREFNELSLNRDRDGLYGDVDESVLLPEIRQAVATLKKGEITTRLVETIYGYHIIRLESKRAVRDKGGSEPNKLTLRQIVIRNKFQAPTKNTAVPAPFEEAAAIARDTLKEEKGKRLKADLAARNHIKLPEDITI